MEVDCVSRGVVGGVVGRLIGVKPSIVGLGLEVDIVSMGVVVWLIGVKSNIIGLGGAEFVSVGGVVGWLTDVKRGQRRKPGISEILSMVDDSDVEYVEHPYDLESCSL